MRTHSHTKWWSYHTTSRLFLHSNSKERERKRKNGFNFPLNFFLSLNPNTTYVNGIEVYEKKNKQWDAIEMSLYRLEYNKNESADFRT